MYRISYEIELETPSKMVALQVYISQITTNEQIYQHIQTSDK